MNAVDKVINERRAATVQRAIEASKHMHETIVISMSGGLRGTATTASIDDVDYERRPDELPGDFELRILKLAKPCQVVVFGGPPKSMELGNW